MSTYGTGTYGTGTYGQPYTGPIADQPGRAHTWDTSPAYRTTDTAPQYRTADRPGT